MTRIRFRYIPRDVLGLAAVTGPLLLLLGLSSPAAAVVNSVAVFPAAPRACDPVGIAVAGGLPGDCFNLVGATIRGPDPVLCILAPCPRQFRVEITVKEPDPRLMRPCTTEVIPYTRSFDVGKLPPGRYDVYAHERVIPYFGPDSTDSTISESFATTSFVVGEDSTCVPNLGCYVLTFRNFLRDPPPGLLCDGGAAPGGTACIPLSLMNTKAVAGLQTTIVATAGDVATSADPFLHPVSVSTTSRAQGFEVTWVAEGSSAKILLYSLVPGAQIAAGDGPVLQICYSVAPETPPQTFLVRDTATIVADAAGGALPVCPTFARVAGRICVTAPAPSCDLNGDGVSDVLDIIRLVGCALASTTGSTPACPDSVAARADCNGDGSVDIRDVICCVRKIVGLSRPGQFPSEIGMPGGTFINFDGPVTWTSATEGVARVRVDVPPEWGGVEFSVDPGGAPVRISGVALEGGSAPQGTMIESATDASGVAHALLFSAATGARPASSIRVLVNLVRTASGTGSSIRLESLKAGTASGAENHVSSYAPVLQLEGAPSAAPALFEARPNPFAGQTEIAFVLPTDARTTLNIYDVRGRLVRRLVQGPTTAGIHRIQWNGLDDRGKAARSGIYFAKLIVGSTNRTERIMLLR